MRKLVLTAALAATLACFVGGNAFAGVILSEDFTSDSDPTMPTNQAELESKGWTFSNITEVGGGSALGFSDAVGSPEAPGGDDYLKMGGNIDTGNPMAVYALGQDVAQGSMDVKIGTTNSFAGINLRMMDGATELFNLRLQSRNKVFVKGDTEDAYSVTTNPNLDLAMLGSSSSGDNWLTASFSWTVNPDGTSSTLSYDLDQPASSNPTKLDTGLVAGKSFIVDGVPDGIKLENTTHNNSARDVLLAFIEVNQVPEPGTLLLGVMGLCGLGIRRRR